MPAAEGRVIQRDVAQRWTPALAKAGWTPVSDFFLDNFHRLEPEIRHGEAMLIILLMRHKWDSGAPFPGFKSIAKRLGLSMTAARALARQLEQKGYIVREKKVGSTNRFQLQPLFTALEALMARDKELKGGDAADRVSLELVARFLRSWVKLEMVATYLASQTRIGKAQESKQSLKRNPFLIVSLLASLEIIDVTTFEELDAIRRIREAVVQGNPEFRKQVTPEMIKRLDEITEELSTVNPKGLPVNNQA